jgi:hypothetical protein
MKITATRHLALFALLISAAACTALSPQAPNVTVSQISSQIRPPKPPDCTMPVLYSEPPDKFEKIAIVEGWVEADDQQSQLIDALKDGACSVGADALLMVDQRSQKTKHLLYGKEPDPDRPETHPGEVMMAKEHRPPVGEAGHSGDYIDAAAIVIGDPNSPQSATAK